MAGSKFLAAILMIFLMFLFFELLFILSINTTVYI